MVMPTRPRAYGNRIERAVDTVIGLFNPRKAFMRSHFRRMERDPDYRENVFTLMRARGYRNASSGSQKTPWGGTSRDADGEITGNRKQLVSRSREVNRDDPVASGLTGTYVHNWIGTGMTPQAQTGDDAKDDALEAVWELRKDSLYPADLLDYEEAQSLNARKLIEDGEVLVKQARRPRRYGADPVWFEIVESDRLATPQQLAGEELAGRIREGVERDENGWIVAFHIRKTHPGKMSVLDAADRKFARVEAGVVRHLKFTRRPGQSRGVPLFHAVLQDLRDLDLLIVASLKRTQISACLSIFIKSPLPADQILDITAEKYGYKLDDTLEPGMIMKLFPGEEVQTIIPNFPGSDLVPFILLLARRIGAALGVSWQVVLKDFSQANYSSARTDLMESRQVYVVLQRWFETKLLKWEWRTVMEDALLRREPLMVAAGVELADIRKVKWIPNGWDWVDPVKEAKGKEIELKMKVTSPYEICASKGKDFPTVLRQCLKAEQLEIRLREEMKLPARAPDSAFEPAAADTDPDDDKDDDPPPPARRGLMALLQNTLGGN